MEEGNNLIEVLELLEEDVREWAVLQEHPWIYRSVANELRKVVEKLKLDLKGEAEPF